MGAVAILIHRLAVGTVEIIAVNVVSKAVVVIVDTVAWYLGCIGPHVGGKVGMVVINPRIDYGNDQARVARLSVPGFDDIHIRTDRAGLAVD